MDFFEFYGRKLNDKLRKGTPLHLYLPGPHQDVFNLEAFGVSNEMILCESLIDALTFWSAGFRNVTCSYGIEGFTQDLLNAFRHHKTERVLIAYDRDQAGEKAASSLAAKLMSEGLDCMDAVLNMMPEEKRVHYSISRKTNRHRTAVIALL